MTMRRISTLLFFLVAGCSSSSGSQSAPLPSAEEIEAFTRVSNIFAVPVDVDGTTAIMGVDTGDPFVLLNPASFPLAPANGTVGTIDVAGQTFTNAPVITSSESPTSPDPAVPFGGLFGCFILCSSVATFNYRDVVFTLGTPPSISGVLPEITLPFALEGGGVTQDDGTLVTIPASRVVVTVDIEGNSYRMIVDSGASEVVLDAAAFTALTSDGRTQLTAGGVESTAGVSTASYTRSKTIAVGGAQATNVIVAHDTSFDTNIATVATDSGEAIRGSLGGTFLEHFNVTIDYPALTLHLTPYADTSFIYDPGELLGFSLQTGASDGYSISEVFAGSDAQAKGARVGDVILGIDGQQLVGLTSSQIGLLLGGKVGSTRAVQFGAAQTLANQTVNIAVNELLTIPP